MRPRFPSVGVTMTDAGFVPSEFPFGADCDQSEDRFRAQPVNPNTTTSSKLSHRMFGVINAGIVWLRGKNQARATVASLNYHAAFEDITWKTAEKCERRLTKLASFIITNADRPGTHFPE